jgi:hypothetical protein
MRLCKSSLGETTKDSLSRKFKVGILVGEELKLSGDLCDEHHQAIDCFRVGCFGYLNAHADNEGISRTG